MSVDIVDIFTGRPMNEAVSDAPLLKRQRRPYKAFEMGEDFQWSLEIHPVDGRVMQFPYHYQSGATYRGSSLLALMFRNIDVVILLSGRNLYALKDPMQDRLVRTLYCFNEGRYLHPGNEETVITEMRILSVKSYYDILEAIWRKGPGLPPPSRNREGR